MKLKSLVVLSVTAMVLVAGGGGSAAADPAPCVIQRHLLRIALTAADPAVDTAGVARVVEQLWAAEGVDFEWINEAEAASEERLDAWVVIGPKADHSFAGRTVFVLIDEVIDRFEQRLSVQMQISRDSARHLLFSRHLLEQSLGYAVAHRLGHAILGLPHAARGLMGNAYDPAPGVTALAAIDLDAPSRRVLQRRFGIGCLAVR